MQWRKLELRRSHATVLKWGQRNNIDLLERIGRCRSFSLRKLSSFDKLWRDESILQLLSPSIDFERVDIWSRSVFFTDHFLILSRRIFVTDFWKRSKCWLRSISVLRVGFDKEWLAMFRRCILRNSKNLKISVDLIFLFAEGFLGVLQWCLMFEFVVWSHEKKFVFKFTRSISISPFKYEINPNDIPFQCGAST